MNFATNSAIVQKAKIFLLLKIVTNSWAICRRLRNANIVNWPKEKLQCFCKINKQKISWSKIWELFATIYLSIRSSASICWVCTSTKFSTFYYNICKMIMFALRWSYVLSPLQKNFWAVRTGWKWWICRRPTSAIIVNWLKEKLLCCCRINKLKISSRKIWTLFVTI